jgi:hypothetical protein
MTLFTLHAAPSFLAAGFSLLLVVSLVAAEEIELRRKRDPAGN